jgi:hypothetical protein
MRWLLPLVAALCAIEPAMAAEPLLRFIGQQTVATGTIADGTVVGGLSGIDYDPATGRYVAISDDRSRHAPARYYDIALALTLRGFEGVRFTGVHFMQQPDHALFPSNGIDAESIRFSGRDLLYASEGNARAGVAPFVREMREDGGYVRSFAVPAHYLPGHSGGVRNNLAFESLTLSADGRYVLTATEDTLVQDGAPASRRSGGRSRIVCFDRASGEPVAEYVYEIEAGTGSSAGLSELLALDGTRYLALERSAEPEGSGQGHAVKLFLIDLADASNVLDQTALAGDYRPVTKSLLLDLGMSGIPLDNIEGMTFGGTLENGNRSLILVSDNNFSKAQVTQFLAFEVMPAGAQDRIILASSQAPPHRPAPIR